MQEHSNQAVEIEEDTTMVGENTVEDKTTSTKETATNLKTSDKGDEKLEQAPVRKPNKRYIFPIRLFDMVENAKEQGYDHIVSWTEDGKAFVLKDIPVFEKEILPKYFGHSRMRSFSRQLCYWAFERIISKGPKNGAYEHVGFVTGNRSLLSSIKRHKFKGCAMKMSGVYINLKQTISVEALDQAVSILQQAELNCMHEVVTRNLLRDTSSQEGLEVKPLNNTRLITFPRSVSCELSKKEQDIFFASDDDEKMVESKSHQDQDSDQRRPQKELSPNTDFSLLDEPAPSTRNEEPHLIEGGGGSPPYLTHIEQATMFEDTTGVVPFEGRFFHDVEAQESSRSNCSQPYYPDAYVRANLTDHGSHEQDCTRPLFSRDYVTTGIIPIYPEEGKPEEHPMRSEDDCALLQACCESVVQSFQPPEATMVNINEIMQQPISTIDIFNHGYSACDEDSLLSGLENIIEPVAV
jgi:hypothetical protein